jgi:hypothetical protein
MILEETPRTRFSFQVFIALSLSITFFIAGQFLIIFSGIDVANLAVANFFASLILITFVNMYKSFTVPLKKPKQEKKPLKHYVQSIEDKCKAINQVIGRVYSTQHNGNEDMRKKIKINSEWYNDLNESTDISKIKQAIIQIKLRLSELEKTESEVFGDDIKNVVNLKRNDDGHWRIIDVLQRNDKDPIMTYYRGALQYCEHALKNY